jgi:hypothetical protein
MKTMNVFLLCTILLTSSIAAQTDNSESVDSVFTASGQNLTDEQAKAAQDFVHQGRRDAVIRKGCEQKELQNCNPSPQDEGVLFKGGIGAALENNISKLYTVIFGGMGFLTGGGGPTVNLKAAENVAAPVNPPADAAAAAPAQPEQRTRADYCMYGAMAGEVLSQGMQMTGQSQAQAANANLNDPQLQALANLKETHKTRKKSAMLQSTVYGAVTACYAAQAFTGVSMDAKYIAKMGAAAGIAVLYKMKADKHAKAMTKVQAVIDSLPKAGDCNPYTGTACFCNEKTSQALYASQYQEVCVLNGGNSDGTMAVTGCAELKSGTVAYDEDCSCKTTNSCFSTKVSTFNPQFSLGKNFMDSANKGFDLAQAGTVDQAQLGAFTTANTALFNRIKDKLNTSQVPRRNLTNEQKKTAAALSTIMPAAVAGLAAASDPGTPAAGGLMDSSSTAALKNIPESLKKELEAEVSGNYRSSGGANNTNAATEEAPFTFPIPGQETTSENGSEVVSFAQRAVDGAEVSNRPETPIFDIISNRYRNSGWSRVQVEP